MTASVPSSNESLFMVPAILSGVAVAAILSPKDSYFMGNIAIYWAPQAIILAILIFFQPRPAVISGVAVILALYLTIWCLGFLSTKSSVDGLVGILFFFARCLSRRHYGGTLH